MNGETEHYYAEMESERATAEDSYFRARPQMQRTAMEQSIFRAGFEKAFAKLWKPGWQARVFDWMKACFQGPEALRPEQRAFRFIEEALELAQAAGTSKADALRLVEYVYGRPRGLVSQEIGGVMVTLGGLATAFCVNMEYCADYELKRCIENTDKIRAKDLAKPQRSPLPGSTDEVSNADAAKIGRGLLHD